MPRETYKSFLRNKISENMREYKSGRWSSAKQALAVSYSQARKRFPRNKSAQRKSGKCSRNEISVKGYRRKNGTRVSASCRKK